MAGSALSPLVLLPRAVASVPVPAGALSQPLLVQPTWHHTVATLPACARHSNHPDTPSCRHFDLPRHRAMPLCRYERYDLFPYNDGVMLWNMPYMVKTNKAFTSWLLSNKNGMYFPGELARLRPGAPGGEGACPLICSSMASRPPLCRPL